MKIHAAIVAMDAMENILFVHIFLIPCLMVYPNVLIFIFFTAHLYITDYMSLLQCDDTFLHCLNDLHVMADYQNGCATFVDLV